MLNTLTPVHSTVGITPATTDRIDELVRLLPDLTGRLRDRARSTIVTMLAPVARGAAIRRCHARGVSYDVVDDLVQDAMLALTEALVRAERNLAAVEDWGTYLARIANSRIRQAERNSPAARSDHAQDVRFLQAQHAIDDLTALLQRQPSAGEVTDHVNARAWATRRDPVRQHALTTVSEVHERFGLAM